jgi:DNA-binding NarL/FixJ family response regulator
LARILIIDDEREVRMALRAILERAGHTVIEAPNGDQGARLYALSPTEVVITDIVMPGKDGVETLMELRADFPNIKIIVISGEADDLLPAVQQFGARFAFPKPLRSKEILAAIDELLAEDA